MKEIINYQYNFAEVFLQYLQQGYDADILQYTNIELNILEIEGIVFFMVIFLSLASFVLGSLFSNILKFRAYNADKYRILLFFNIFYIVPFIYGFIGAKVSVSNIFIIFLSIAAYFSFGYVVNNPDLIIDFLTQKGFYI